jgi:Bacteriophage tail sheath protein
MPEYLAPGVYVEETSFRSKSIEGVSTTTTGFIGPCRYGPLDIEPDILTSLADFEAVYGDRQKLEFSQGAEELDNYLWHAVRAFFEEGGKRLYVVRIFRPGSSSPGWGTARVPDKEIHPNAATVELQFPSSLCVRSRFPGEAGNLQISFTLRVSQNVLTQQFQLQGQNRVLVNTVRSLLNNDVVLISHGQSPPHSPPSASDFHLAAFDPVLQNWTFQPNSVSPVASSTISLNQLHPEFGDRVQAVTLTVTVQPTDELGFSQVWADLPLDPNHVRAGAPDSLSAKFAPIPASRDEARTLPIVVTLGDALDSGLQVLDALFAAKPDWPSQLENPKSTDADRSFNFALAGGNDGERPESSDYEGTAELDSNIKTGLKAFEDIEEISILAAPGSTFGFETQGYGIQAQAIVNLLIAHATLMRYRIAVLDSGDGQTIAQVRAMRGQIDSTYAALYYPWVRVVDPVTDQEIELPPSGFVAGIYARNDINRAVYKAPANEVVNLAIGFEKLLNKSQQDVLNPEGINCFRFFEGRGYRLWGARTVSSDPEWKYVNLRRYFAYLERSIDKGTQWAVFEPNGELLWGNVRRTIEDFLLNEWHSGALLGDKPEKAYFVKCDRSTMTQNDLDNGRLVCLIGVAPLRPAEFVIFRIGQWTADAKM